MTISLIELQLSMIIIVVFAITILLSRIFTHCARLPLLCLGSLWHCSVTKLHWLSVLVWTTFQPGNQQTWRKWKKISILTFFCILITCLLNNELILHREILSWSLVKVKGLKPSWTLDLVARDNLTYLINPSTLRSD